MDANRENTETLEQPPYTLYEEWLGESRFMAGLLAALDESLILFAAKRTTLEEKAIKHYFRNLARDYCRLLLHVHEYLGVEQIEPREGEGEALEHLRTLNLNVHEALTELLRAQRHNPNFVEQYFEYDFYARLTEEHKFLEEIAAVMRKMGIKS